MQEVAQGDGSDDEDGSAADVQLPAKSVPAKKIVAQQVSAPVVPQVQPLPPAPKPIVVAVAKPPAPPTAATNSATSWGIQIGAYGDPEVGRAALANVASMLPQLLGDADPVIQKVTSGTVTMFRARLMSLDQRTAQQACTYLNQHGQGCLPVGP
jgi:D-alanyl-D-alanine carboxypeptidase